MAEERMPEVGQHVMFVDPVGQNFDALVTTVWNPDMINLVYIDGDEVRQDSYGRQISRATSLSHVSKSQVHGQYWRFTDEENNPYTPPAAK